MLEVGTKAPTFTLPGFVKIKMQKKGSKKYIAQPAP